MNVVEIFGKPFELKDARHGRGVPRFEINTPSPKTVKHLSLIASVMSKCIRGNGTISLVGSSRSSAYRYIIGQIAPAWRLSVTRASIITPGRQLERGGR